LDAAREQVDEALGSFEFFRAVDALYHVTFDDFCDWYAEAIKPRLYDGDEDAQATALANLERLLALLHPVLPHVTEEIWSNLPARETRLIVAPWPGGCGARSPARRGCWPTSALFRTRPARWSRPSARSSSATVASSMPSPLEWLESLSPWPEEFGLGRMHALLAEVGEPQRAFRAIHVVGTNGKSTST